MVTPPILDNKNALMPSVFVPTALLREARRQKKLDSVEVPPICILDPDGDLVRHLRRNASANSFSGWPCYHTELDTFDLGGQQVGIVGRVVGASVGSRAALRPATIGEVSAYDFCAHSVAMTESDSARFRREAEECRQMSARATSPKDKAVWLKLASDWSNLAENAERKGHSRL